MPTVCQASGFTLAADVLRENDPDPNRVHLWLKGERKKRFQLWERVSGHLLVRVFPAPGLAATPVRVAAFRQEVAGDLRKLFLKFWGGRAKSASRYILPTGGWAEPLGPPRADALLVWTPDGQGDAGVTTIEELWSGTEEIRQLGPNLFLVLGVEPVVESPPPSSQQPEDSRPNADSGVSLKTGDEVVRAAFCPEAVLEPSRPGLAHLRQEFDRLSRETRQLGRQGQWPEAGELATQLLNWSLGHWGKDHPLIITALNQLGWVQQASGDHAAAEQSYRQALEVACSDPVNAHPNWATSLNNLALLYQARGDHLGAASLHQRALGIRRACLGEGHPLVAATLNNLGLLYYPMGDPPAARALLCQALDVLSAALGENHPDLGVCLENLAGLCRALGDGPTASLFAGRAEQVRQAAQGNHYARIADSLNFLAEWDSSASLAVAEPPHHLESAGAPSTQEDNQPAAADGFTPLVHDTSVGEAAVPVADPAAENTDFTFQLACAPWASLPPEDQFGITTSSPPPSDEFPFPVQPAAFFSETGDEANDPYSQLIPGDIGSESADFPWPPAETGGQVNHPTVADAATHPETRVDCLPPEPQTSEVLETSEVCASGLPALETSDCPEPDDISPTLTTQISAAIDAVSDPADADQAWDYRTVASTGDYSSTAAEGLMTEAAELPIAPPAAEAPEGVAGEVSPTTTDEECLGYWDDLTFPEGEQHPDSLPTARLWDGSSPAEDARLTPYSPAEAAVEPESAEDQHPASELSPRPEVAQAAAADVDSCAEPAPAVPAADPCSTVPTPAAADNSDEPTDQPSGQAPDLAPAAAAPETDVELEIYYWDDLTFPELRQEPFREEVDCPEPEPLQAPAAPLVAAEPEAVLDSPSTAEPPDSIPASTAPEPELPPAWVYATFVTPAAQDQAEESAATESPSSEPDHPNLASRATADTRHHSPVEEGPPAAEEDEDFEWDDLIVPVEDRDTEADGPLDVPPSEPAPSPYGPADLQTATDLTRSAEMYLASDDEAAAEPLFRQAVEIRRSILGQDHPACAEGLTRLALLCAATGRAAEALVLLREALAANATALAQSLPWEGDSPAGARLHALRTTLDRLLSLVWQQLADSPEAVRVALDMVLRCKGIAAEVLSGPRGPVLARRYPHLRSQLEKVPRLKARTDREDSAPVPSANGHTAEPLASQGDAGWEAQEQELARQIPALALEQRLRAADHREVALALPAGNALVEFVSFRVFDFQATLARGERSCRPARYLAFVLLAGEPDSIRLIDLGETAPVDRMIADFRAGITGAGEGETQPGRSVLGEAPAHAVVLGLGGRLRRAVFDPLAGALAGRTRLFLAPAGNLACLPFEVLPAGEGRHLLDTHQITYLAAGGDLLRLGSAATGQPGPAVVAADPDFDLGSVGAVSPRSVPWRTPAAVLLSHGPDGSLPRFQRLTGTRRCARAVADLLGVEPWLEKTVRKNRLQALTSPRILHLATHCFFSTASDPGQGKDEGGFCPENPLLGSGLALAGANRRRRGYVWPDMGEDGLLTAAEVSGLDLLDTELVVLPACTAGVGDAQVGASVLGLRQALARAGAETVVTSLWKVTDWHAKELLLDFYGRVLAGEPRGEALRQARLALKERYPHQPAFWGAFVCQGEPGPLRAPHDLESRGMSSHLDAAGGD